MTNKTSHMRETTNELFLSKVTERLALQGSRAEGHTTRNQWPPYQARRNLYSRADPIISKEMTEMAHNTGKHLGGTGKRLATLRGKGYGKPAKVAEQS